jgi:hypothetical protein
MTLHRWRKMPLARTNGQALLDQIAELGLENARLRRLVIKIRGSGREEIIGVTIPTQGFL